MYDILQILEEAFRWGLDEADLKDLGKDESDLSELVEKRNGRVGLTKRGIVEYCNLLSRSVAEEREDTIDRYFLVQNEYHPYFAINNLNVKPVFTVPDLITPSDSRRSPGSFLYRFKIEPGDLHLDCATLWSQPAESGYYDIPYPSDYWAIQNGDTQYYGRSAASLLETISNYQISGRLTFAISDAKTYLSLLEARVESGTAKLASCRCTFYLTNDVFSYLDTVNDLSRRFDLFLRYSGLQEEFERSKRNGSEVAVEYERFRGSRLRFRYDAVIEELRQAWRYKDASRWPFAVLVRAGRLKVLNGVSHWLAYKSGGFDEEWRKREGKLRNYQGAFLGLEEGTFAEICL